MCPKTVSFCKCDFTFELPHSDDLVDFMIVVEANNVACLDFVSEALLDDGCYSCWSPGVECGDTGLHTAVQSLIPSYFYRSSSQFSATVAVSNVLDECHVPYEDELGNEYMAFVRVRLHGLSEGKASTTNSKQRTTPKKALKQQSSSEYCIFSLPPSFALYLPWVSLRFKNEV
jgi:hypothetical protein